MFVATTLLAFTLAGAAPSRPITLPVHQATSETCIAPDRTGTFRVMAMRPDGRQALLAVLLLENIEGCLEVSFVTDSRGPAVLEQLSVSGDTLKGSLNVTGNRAQVTFRFVGTTVAGTIVDGRVEWRVEGKRTS